MSDIQKNNELLKYTEEVATRESTKPGSSFAVNGNPAQAFERTAAGGENQIASSNLMGGTNTVLSSRHGATNILSNDLESISRRPNDGTYVIPTSVKTAEVGGTGYISSNGYGNQAIAYNAITNNQVTNEPHIFLGINYNIFSGTLFIPTDNVPAVSVLSVHENSTVFPIVGPASSGAGYTVSSSGIYFTNGSYSNWKNASQAGYIPGSGVIFGIDYIYTSATINYIGSISYTTYDNDLKVTNYIPNVNNRFAR